MREFCIKIGWNPISSYDVPSSIFNLVMNAIKAAAVCLPEQRCPVFTGLAQAYTAPALARFILALLTS